MFNSYVRSRFRAILLAALSSAALLALGHTAMAQGAGGGGMSTYHPNPIIWGLDITVIVVLVGCSLASIALIFDAIIHLRENKIAPVEATEHIRSLTDARALQVDLGTLGDGAGIALITLTGGGLNDVAADNEGGFIRKRIENGRVGLGQENHVGLVDALPAGDRGAIKSLAIDEGVFFDSMAGDGDVLLLTLGIGKAEIDKLDVFFFNQLDHITGAITHLLLLQSRNIHDPKQTVPTKFIPDQNHPIGNNPDSICTNMVPNFGAIQKCALL